MRGETDPYRCRVLVRPGVESDIPRLVELGRHFYEQTAYRKVPYSERGAGDWYRLMLSNELLFVATVDSKVIGVLGGAVVPFLINPEHGIGTELLLWVEPEYRASGAATLLMDAVEAKASELGLTYWSMMSLEAVQPEVAAKIYHKRGYTPAEHTFVKEL